MTTNNILVLGSACRTLDKAEQLIEGLDQCRAIHLDVSSDIELESAIAESDLVISLIPYAHHPKVIEAAIKNKTNVVTTSYISPAIRALDQAAKQAGIVVLNEVGVDPGVDHCYAVKTISEVHAQHGKIKEFYSYCGGLPAPECADNPLRMKFSWSPKGVFMSQCNSASFIKDGERVDIPAEELMASAVPYHVMDGYDFLAYPNRNTVPFRELYNIPEAHTIVRGSLRYDGNPQLTRALLKIGWLDAQPQSWLTPGITWAEATGRAIRVDDFSEGNLISRIKEIITYAENQEQEQMIVGLRWIGLFSTDPAPVQDSLLDTLAAHLQTRVGYQTGERDLVMLQHKFVIEWADGRAETRTSTMELLGDPKGHSGMALSVGITCGIAAQLVLDGEPGFDSPGVLAPYSIAICTPLREKFEKEGIRLVERVV